MARRVRSLGAPPPGDAQLSQFLDVVKEHIEIGRGTRGDPLDRWITLRELQAGTGINIPGSSISGPLSPSAQPASLPEGITDYTQPPDPQNLAVTGGYATIFVEWEIPEPYKSSGRHAFAEVWAATRAEGGPLPVLADAVLVGSSRAEIYADAVGANGVIRHYWIRAVSDTGDPADPYRYSEWVGGTNGASAQAAVSPQVYLDALNGAEFDGITVKQNGFRISSPDGAQAAITPFTVITTPQTIDGVLFQPGVYMDAAYLMNLTAVTARFGTAWIDDAMIANLSAAKITTGDLSADRMSANIVSALTGKFATLSALTSLLGTVTIDAVGWLKTQGVTDSATGTGMFLGYEAGAYKFRVGDPLNGVISWDGSKAVMGLPGGARAEVSGGTLTLYGADGVTVLMSSGAGIPWGQVTGAGKPADNATVGATFGVDIGGQITSSNIGTYIANAAIQTAQIANLAVGTAQIASAAITNAKIGTAAVQTAHIGDLQVSTLKIQDNAVTVPSSSYVAGASNLTPTEGSEGENFNTVASTSVTVPSGTPVHVSAGVRIKATYLSVNTPRPTYIHAQLLNPSGTVIADGYFGYTYNTAGSSVTEYAHVTLVGASTVSGAYSLRVAVHWDLAGVSASQTQAEYKTIAAIGAKK